MVEIQYKPTLVESDQSDINRLINSPRSSLSISGMELLNKTKYHLGIHIELKERFRKENIFPSGFPIVQVPGADAFLNDFVDLYTNNPEFKESLYVCLLQGVPTVN